MGQRFGLLELASALNIANGLFVVAELAVCLGSVQVVHMVCWVQAQRLCVVGNGLIVVFQVEVRISPVVERNRVVWLELQCSVVVG